MRSLLYKELQFHLSTSKVKRGEARKKRETESSGAPFSHDCDGCCSPSSGEGIKKTRKGNATNEPLLPLPVLQCRIRTS